MTLLTVDRVDKTYRTGGLLSGARRQVLSNISFDWKQGECLGIIGESGCGKSTLGRLLLGIERSDRGSIKWEGQPIDRRITRTGRISAVFQNYTSSINPFYTVEQALMEPLRLLDRKRSYDEVHDRIARLLNQVGLDAAYRHKYPHQLSGGEAQRVCIARAIASEPQCVILDEAVSSLDGAVQLQILQLLQSLKSLYGTGYIFITHDIQAAAFLCDRIMTMRNGRLEDIIAIDQLKNVQSPYARKLLRLTDYDKP